MQMVRSVLLDRQTAYEKARLLRETKTIGELLGGPQPEYEMMEPEDQPASSIPPTQDPAPADPPESEPQTSSSEVKRRSLLGR